MNVTTVDDTVVFGVIHRHSITCCLCRRKTYGILIGEVNLPEGISRSPKIILIQLTPDGVEPIPNIGIGCGCYARAHRQIAHIQDRIAAKSAQVNRP